MLYIFCGLILRYDSLFILEWYRFINDNVDVFKLKCFQVNFEKEGVYYLIFIFGFKKVNMWILLFNLNVRK